MTLRSPEFYFLTVGCNNVTGFAKLWGGRDYKVFKLWVLK